MMRKYETEDLYGLNVLFNNKNVVNTLNNRDLNESIDEQIDQERLSGNSRGESFCFGKRDLHN